jgi:hypothetical protein
MLAWPCSEQWPAEHQPNNKNLNTLRQSAIVKAKRRIFKMRRATETLEVFIFQEFMMLERAKGIEPSYAAWEAES